MLETLLRSYPRCLLKVNNLKAMVMLHNFVVRQGTLCMHVHCTEGCISGKRQAFIKKFKLIYRCFTLLSVHIVIKNRGPTVTK